MPGDHSVELKPSIPFSCIPHFLEHHAKCTPDAPAILAPGRQPLTYGRLYQHIVETEHSLRATGIARHDRIVVVLPNGPEMAMAFLAVASCATCVPLNPAYGTEELTRYFADLRPRALITVSGEPTAARRVAQSSDIPIIELAVSPQAEAGLFILTGMIGEGQSDQPVHPSDVALLLPTSGTTANPKIVPLTHANLCTCAYDTVRALALTEADRCINVVPLFHGHGLNNTLLGSMAAGASIVCAPGCDVSRFFSWLSEFHATWYSAVPTMHQAILAQAWLNRERCADYRLRLIRSSSAPLPQPILAELEATFQTPVIEVYGMTESASAPIACNPLPPGRRKPGSVGMPVGLKVAIMGEEGDLLPVGQTGQVVVRGASVITGYDRDRAATEAAFADGWFKTGDLGYFDEDGYLFLAGRLREIINRGGEKVSPQEVDDVLAGHPAVAEAVTFPIPHATLGEEVATAIVLRPSAVAAPQEIRRFAQGRLSDFKVPKQVVIVSEIPRGPTGKLQRLTLAARLGILSPVGLQSEFAAPRTALESTLAEHWAEILGVTKVGINDDFFVLGGDSLLATQVIVHVYGVTQIQLDVAQFFEAPTVAEVAQLLEKSLQLSQTTQSSSAILPVPRAHGLAPTSVAQERLWALSQALEGLPYFNTLYPLRLTLSVDVAILERSINEIIKRHEVLRTTFAVINDEYLQVIAPHLMVRLRFQDAGILHESEKKAAVEKLIQKELLHCFDLEQGPLIRANMMRLADCNYLLLITIHGIIEDGWSLGVFIKELAILYDAYTAGKETPLKPLPIQYADFANWQRRWSSYPDIYSQRNYWLEQLRHPLPLLNLSGEPRQKSDDLRTERRQVAFPLELSEAAKHFSRREGVTLFMTLIAAFKTLLHRRTGEEDLRVATHVANRNRPGTEGLIGPLVNTVILRTNLGGNPSFREVLRRVRKTILAAFSNQDLPFDEVVAALEQERGVAPQDLVQIMMWLHNATLRPIISCNKQIVFEELDPSTMLPLATVSGFEIMLMLRESAQGLLGTCVYKPTVCSAAVVDCLLQEFQQVLEHMVSQSVH